MDDDLGLEWARVAPDKVVVATADRAFVHTPSGLGAADRFGGPMRGPGSPTTTRRLLDGAVGAAQRAAVRAEALPALSPLRWALRLAGYYCTTHATPRLMEEAATRFAAAGRHALAGWALHKARDERGHDELALRDLRALGYDAERVVEVISPPTAIELVAYFERAVHAEDPVGCVGYAYALERLALAQTEAYVKRVEAMLPAGVYATRCLRVHSAIGSDARHVAETIAMVAGLTAPERAQIALACYETTALCYAPKRGEIISEDTLASMLSPLKTKGTG